MRDYHIPLIPNEAYHILNHANGFENLFANKGNYEFFLKKYALYVQPIAKTYAYCLLPNHFHFLVSIRSEEELAKVWVKLKPTSRKFETFVKLSSEEQSNFISRQFGRLFSSYAKAFNKQQNRRGSLFIPNFKRSHITNDTYFYTVLRYIHQNPVRHGFRKNLLDWEHSSIHSYFWMKRKSNVDRETVLEWFGSNLSTKSQEFWDFHKQGWTDDELDLDI